MPKKFKVKPKSSRNKPLKPKKNLSIPQFYGYTHKDFKRWGKLGGRPQKYANVAERMRAYRLRKKLKGIIDELI